MDASATMLADTPHSGSRPCPDATQKNSGHPLVIVVLFIRQKSGFRETQAWSRGETQFQLHTPE